MSSQPAHKKVGSLMFAVMTLLLSTALHLHLRLLSAVLEKLFFSHLQNSICIWAHGIDTNNIHM